jgi:hypothetical protein
VAETKGPHVFEKMGMMAEAIAGGPADEEAFRQHMRGGICRQAEAVLAEGRFYWRLSVFIRGFKIG